MLPWIKRKRAWRRSNEKCVCNEKTVVEYVWVNKWVNKWISEWVNEWMNEWMRTPSTTPKVSVTSSPVPPTAASTRGSDFAQKARKGSDTTGWVWWGWGCGCVDVWMCECVNMRIWWQSGWATGCVIKDKKWQEHGWYKYECKQQREERRNARKKKCDIVRGWIKGQSISKQKVRNEMT